MTEKNKDFIGGLIIGLVVGTLLCCLVLLVQQTLIDNSWRGQITAHGCGYYYLDQNFQRQWNWNDCKK